MKIARQTFQQLNLMMMIGIMEWDDNLQSFSRKF